MVTFKEAVRDFIKRAVEFNGVSTRAQYWWAILASILFSLVVGVIAGLFVGFGDVLGGFVGTVLGYVGTAFQIVIGIAWFVAFCALFARRIHDAGFSEWVYFMPMILLAEVEAMGFGLFGLGPVLRVVLGIFGLVLALMPSKTKGNPYRK